MSPRDRVRGRSDAVDQVGPADELGDEARPRAVEELLSRADLGHAPLLEHRHAVRNDHGLGLVVGDIERGDREQLVQAPNLKTHFFSEVCVEVAQWLVEEQDLGLHHQRPRDGDTLLLAAGQLAGIAGAVALELDRLQDVVHSPVPVDLRRPGEAQPVRDVLIHRHVRPQSVALEDHGHSPSLGWDHRRRR